MSNILTYYSVLICSFVYKISFIFILEGNIISIPRVVGFIGYVFIILSMYVVCLCICMVEACPQRPEISDRSQMFNNPTFVYTVNGLWELQDTLRCLFFHVRDFFLTVQWCLICLGKLIYCGLMASSFVLNSVKKKKKEMYTVIFIVSLYYKTIFSNQVSMVFLRHLRIYVTVCE